MTNLYQCIIILSNIIFSHEATSNRYQVTRKKVDNGEFSESIDSFTNTNMKRMKEFCSNLNASCTTQSCETCKCKTGDFWLSYKEGCVDRSYLNITFNIDEERCFKVSKSSTWIPTLSLNISRTKKYKLYTNSNIPPSINTINNICSLKHLRQIWNGTTTLMANYIDAIELGNGVSLKTIQFTDRLMLANLTGMLLVLDIECTDQVKSTIFNSCFLFKIEGTYDMGVIPVPSKQSGFKEKDDDDVMDIVKPVVIAGSIFLVFIGVGFYCVYKRNKYLKQQGERKIFEAEYHSQRKSATARSGYVGSAAHNIAKMSAATVITSNATDAFQTPEYGIQNGGYDYIDTGLSNNKHDDNSASQNITPVDTSKIMPNPEDTDPPPLTNGTTNRSNNNNNKNQETFVPDNREYHELEKEGCSESKNDSNGDSLELDGNSPVCKGDYQNLNIEVEPPKYEELVKPMKVDDFESANPSCVDSNKDVISDKETTNPYDTLFESNENNGITGESDNALYEEVMREYNRIKSLPSNERTHALNQC